MFLKHDSIILIENYSFNDAFPMAPESFNHSVISTP